MLLPTFGENNPEKTLDFCEKLFIIGGVPANNMVLLAILTIGNKNGLLRKCLGFPPGLDRVAG